MSRNLWKREAEARAARLAAAKARERAERRSAVQAAFPARIAPRVVEPAPVRPPRKLKVARHARKRPGPSRDARRGVAEAPPVVLGVQEAPRQAQERAWLIICALLLLLGALLFVVVMAAQEGAF